MDGEKGVEQQIEDSNARFYKAFEITNEYVSKYEKRRNEIWVWY